MIVSRVLKKFKMVVPVFGRKMREGCLAYSGMVCFLINYFTKNILSLDVLLILL